jgi:hypothetical protein
MADQNLHSWQASNPARNRPQEKFTANLLVLN